MPPMCRPLPPLPSAHGLPPIGPPCYSSPFPQPPSWVLFGAHCGLAFLALKGGHSGPLVYGAAPLKLRPFCPPPLAKLGEALEPSDASTYPHIRKATKGVWQNAEAVCFDVDSTVCMDEGIDALGEFCGAGEAVAAWTFRAMGGSVPFEEALAARLSLFKPSLKDVERFLASNPPKITPGIEELIKKLHSKGKAVYLISGGFRQMIAPVAKILQIPEENVFANQLLFDENGNYTGFDIKEPTSKSGGKAAAIAHLKQKCGYNKLVMIGDGATDLEARQPGGADIFICYGGVQFRASVAAQSDWCVLNFRDLIESL